MRDLITALALVLVIEGALWCLFPDQMKRAAELAMRVERGALRVAGLTFAAIGVLAVWFIRS
jgi:uncharacterized protein